MGNRNRASKPGRDRWSDIRGGMAFIVPVALTRHESWRLMSPWAHKLVADLSTQYTGYNNGYLCAAWTLMKDRGWNSKTTLAKTVAELEHYRIIERTQQGGRNRPNLFAFSFRRVDRIDGRYLDAPPTVQPSNAWDNAIPPFNGTSPTPANGPIGATQAQQMDSVCPSSGLEMEN